MNQVKDIKDMLSLVFLKWKQILVGALVVAILIGGFSAYSQIKQDNADDTVDDVYRDMLSDYYEGQKQSIISQIEDKQNSIQLTREYLDESLYMQIDPYNEAVTRIDFSICNIDTAAYQQDFSLTITPLDYLVDQIRGSYRILWQNADISSLINSQGEYGDVNEKYLRELVQVFTNSGGMTEIKVMGASKEETQKTAEAIWNFFCDNQDVVASVTYDHEIVLVSEDTRIEVDTTLDETKNKKIDSISTLENSITKLTESMNKIKVPAKTSKLTVQGFVVKIVKNMLIGAVVGLVVMVAWTLMINIIGGKCITSYEIERNVNITCLGNLKTKYDIIEKVGNRISDERVWKKDDQAQQYVVRRLEEKCGERKNVLFVSSLCLGEDILKPIMEKLEKTGFCVKVSEDVLHDPDGLQLIKNADIVIAMEKATFSKSEKITQINKLCKTVDQNLHGFVLI